MRINGIEVKPSEYRNGIALYDFEDVKNAELNTPAKRKAYEKSLKKFLEENRQAVLKEQIAEVVRKARKESKISQDQLAQKLHTSKSTISRIEKGEQNLTVEYIIKLATVLNKKYEIRIY